MKKIIDLHTQQIQYTLRVSTRARRVRMAVYGNGEFVVTVPTGMRVSVVEQLIASKSAWILKQLARSHSIVHKMSDPESAGITQKLPGRAKSRRKALKHETGKTSCRRLLAGEHGTP